MPLLNVPYLEQNDPGGCLSACAAMVLAYLEQPVLQEEVAQQLGARPWGTPASNIRRLATWGFRVTYETGSLSDLAQRTEAGQAPIVFVRTVDLPYWQEDTPHAVVVVGVEGENIVLLDPAYPEQTPVSVSIDAFLLAWSHFDQAFAVIERD
jgi:ABC-type bacteriocin/lantibiotic exporter with double-glycine peptidase domain